jgi:hypothetical protein
MKLSVSLRFSRSETVCRTTLADDQLVARPLPLYKHRKTRARSLARTHTHKSTKHPCPEWDSNPRSRHPNERRQCMPYRSAAVTGCLSLGDECKVKVKVKVKVNLKVKVKVKLSLCLIS